jgi:hypothetical protein
VRDWPIVLFYLPSHAARAFAADPLFFAVTFGSIGLLMVAWALTDAGRRLQAWSPRSYTIIFGNRPGGTRAAGLARGAFLILLGLFFLYRFLNVR